MAETLYSRAILKLAMTLGDDAMPVDTDGMAQRRSPVCGSEVCVGVALDRGRRISALGMRVSACAMGQASAAILKRHAAGQTGDDIASIRRGIGAFLAGDSDMPGDWPELAELAAARDYPARHGAILLPYEALLAAMENAGAG